jgi:thiol-disulfide isomerase/thioredoxin
MGKRFGLIVFICNAYLTGVAWTMEEIRAFFSKMDNIDNLHLDISCIAKYLDDSVYLHYHNDVSFRFSDNYESRPLIVSFDKSSATAKWACFDARLVRFVDMKMGQCYSIGSQSFNYENLHYEALQSGYINWSKVREKIFAQDSATTLTISEESNTFLVITLTRVKEDEHLFSERCIKLRLRDSLLETMTSTIAIGKDTQVRKWTTKVLEHGNVDSMLSQFDQACNQLQPIGPSAILDTSLKRFTQPYSHLTDSVYNMINNTSTIFSRDKPIIIEFWNLSCIYCKVAEKFLDSLLKTDKSFSVYYLNDQDTSRKLLSRIKEKYSQERDGYHFVIPRPLQLPFNITAYPTFIIVDKYGNIRFRLVGFSEATRYQLLHCLKELQRE